MGEMADTSQRPRRRTSRRRDARSARPTGPVSPLTYGLAPLEALREDQVEEIHRASMKLLSENGMLLIDYPPALERLRSHGVKVEGEMAWIDEDTLMHFVNMAPSTFTLLARNRANDLPVGGDRIIFAPVYGPAFAMDLDNGRRPSTLEDFHNFAKLTYMTPELHHAGGVLAEPNDIHVDERHLDMLLGHLTLNDKSHMGSVIHSDFARDTVTMDEIVFGADAIRRDPASLSIVSISSPMRMDERMLSVLEVYAEAKQAMILASFIIVGAMSPTTLAATIAQQNAESLFAIAYAQMVNPGTPCIQGPFLPNVDMKTGSPAFGTPENALANIAGGQLARRYNLPYRTSACNAANTVDAQATYETQMALWGATMGHGNAIYHAAGWLEGGLVASFEKLIIDVEMMQMMAEFVEPLVVNEETLAIEAMREVQPGGHYFGTSHTMERYDSAFYSPVVSDWTNFENWKEAGGLDAAQRANAIWKQAINDYEQPPLDPAILEELEEYVERRKRELIGADAVLR